MNMETAETIRDEIRSALNEIFDGTKNSVLKDRARYASDRLDELCAYYEEQIEELCMEEINEREEFEFRQRQLAGMADEVTALARKRPETICKAFKAEQLNRVLRPMKALMEEDMGVSLSFVSEEEENSYSDVSLILRGYLDVAASYGRRHYKLNYDLRGQELPTKRYGFRH